MSRSRVEVAVRQAVQVEIRHLERGEESGARGLRLRPQRREKEQRAYRRSHQHDAKTRKQPPTPSEIEIGEIYPLSLLTLKEQQQGDHET